MHWKRRMKAARVVFETGRVETPDERAEREDAERRAEAAQQLKRLIAQSPMGAWFPGDSQGPQWVPSFFTMGRRGE